jgi:hypothetical protein
MLLRVHDESGIHQLRQAILKRLLLFQARHPMANPLILVPDSAVPNCFPVELFDWHGEILGK